MPTYKGKTDEILEIELPSAIVAARWGNNAVVGDGHIALEVMTVYVADGASLKITVRDKDGAPLDTLKGKIFSNLFRTQYQPSKENTTGAMFFEAELPNHGLKSSSPLTAALPPARLRNLQWLDEENREASELQRGRRYTLRADVDKSGDFQTVFAIVYQVEEGKPNRRWREFSGTIVQNKVEIVWEVPLSEEKPSITVEANAEEAPETNTESLETFFQLDYVGSSANSAQIPVVASLQMWTIEMEDTLFNHNSVVVLPSAPEGPGASDGSASSMSSASSANGASQTASGIGALVLVFRYLETHSNKKLLIAGHTDTSGQVLYNFNLSADRAQSIISLLENNRNSWTDSCHGKHKTEDYQQILKHYAQRLGWSCNPGAVDGVFGDATRTALEQFKDNYNSHKNELGCGSEADLSQAQVSGGKLEKEYWAAFFDCYQWEIAKGLSTEVSAMSDHRNRLKFVDDNKKYVACGESFPIEASRRDAYRSQTNRRVELLLFSEGDAPTLNCPASRNTKHTETECPIYGLRRYQANFIAPLWEVKFRFEDEDGEVTEWHGDALPYEVKDREGRVISSGHIENTHDEHFFGDPTESYSVWVDSNLAGSVGGSE